MVVQGQIFTSSPSAAHEFNQRVVQRPKIGLGPVVHRLDVSSRGPHVAVAVRVLFAFAFARSAIRPAVVPPRPYLALSHFTCSASSFGPSFFMSESHWSSERPGFVGQIGNDRLQILDRRVDAIGHLTFRGGRFRHREFSGHVLPTRVFSVAAILSTRGPFSSGTDATRRIRNNAYLISSINSGGPFRCRDVSNSRLPSDSSKCSRCSGNTARSPFASCSSARSRSPAPLHHGPRAPAKYGAGRTGDSRPREPDAPLPRVLSRRRSDRHPADRLRRPLFRGSAERLVLGLVDAEQLSTDDLRQIEAQLAQTPPAHRRAHSKKSRTAKRSTPETKRRKTWRLIDRWLEPGLWLLGDWSLRWGVLIVLLGLWFAVPAASGRLAPGGLPVRVAGRLGPPLRSSLVGAQSLAVDGSDDGRGCNFRTRPDARTQSCTTPGVARANTATPRVPRRTGRRHSSKATRNLP